jgi:hypothetical protein
MFTPAAGIGIISMIGASGIGYEGFELPAQRDLLSSMPLGMKVHAQPTTEHRAAVTDLLQQSGRVAIAVEVC